MIVPRFVIANWYNYLCPEAPLNFFYHFKTNILRLNTGWLTSFTETYHSFDVGGVTYWLCELSFEFDRNVLSNYGVGKLKKYAKDACAYRLFKEFRVLNPGFLMPSHLIGFPNVRGHCYLIVALLPLLHSYPFIVRLSDIYGLISRQRNLGLLRGSFNQRDVIEKPYFWTRLMYTLYIRYYGVSSTTELRLENINQLAIRVNARNPVIYPAYADYQNDLELDRVLVSGVCSALRDYCNNFYNTPGGFEADAYSDVLFKLAAEDATWFDEFFVRVYLSYFCRRCTQHSFGTFQIPLLVLPFDKSLQDALKDLNALFSCQKIFCGSVINGVRCCGEVRRVMDNRVMNFPNVLCFTVPDRASSFTIPEVIIWKVGEVGVRYTRLASSNCFECWETHSGFDYGDLYHIPNRLTDISTGFHTYLTMRTRTRFIEINNGHLYTCDSRLFGRSTPGSIHYYQRSSYNAFVPSVNANSIRTNPEW